MNPEFHLSVTITTAAIFTLALLPSVSSVAEQGEEFACGHNVGKHRLNKRIVGGVKSSECEYPWMVLVSMNQFKCGGSIIDERHVLTAAHCFETDDGSISKAKVYVGGNRLDQLTEVKVLSWRAHPLRKHGKFDFDVAIITLAEKLEFNNCVSPICLPAPGSIPDVHEECTAAGWGSDLHKPVTFYQKKTALPLVNYSDCKKIYGDLLDPSKFCAGDMTNGGIDTCQGDSGGPLMCHSQDGPFIQFGIVSFGISGCAEPDHPGVYTLVNHPTIMDFIQEAVQDI